VGTSRLVAFVFSLVLLVAFLFFLKCMAATRRDGGVQLGVGVPRVAQTHFETSPAVFVPLRQSKSWRTLASDAIRARWRVERIWGSEGASFAFGIQLGLLSFLWTGAVRTNGAVGR
jgi:hypothetical protein